MIACIHIRDDARRHGLGQLLLHATLRDLTIRGEKVVYAYATPGRGDVTYRPLIGVDFLIRHGFTVASAHPQYPLLKLDLRSIVSITENLEAVLQSLRLPVRRPQSMPSPSIKSKEGPLGDR
jgi:N-acetylglutamate synthase-like GNAT family acetyltransferase